MNEKSIIIPIASGKGGVGKSVLTANIAISLAQAGYSTVAIDLDLGGSNLHTHLGLLNEHPGIGDYLNSKKGLLNDYLVRTQFNNLKFLSGECRTTFMANIPYAQKLKLINEIKKIHSDYILLDLGAGTSYNTLDYFGLSNNGIVISTFEKPSIMNTLSFIKNFIYRVIQKGIRHNHKVSKAVNKLYKTSTEKTPLAVSTVLKLIESLEPELAIKIENTCKQFHPRIIFNKGDHPDELSISNQLEKSVKENLSLDLWFFGFIPYDKQIEISTKNSSVLLSHFPECISAKGINNISRRLAKFNNNFVSNSVDLLQKDSLEKYEQWKAELVEK